MKRWRRRIVIALAAVALTLGGLYECATHVGRGWLRGEAFYDGRPTSWWRGELEHWDATLCQFCCVKNGPAPPQAFWLYQRESTWFDRLRERQWRWWQPQPRPVLVFTTVSDGPEILGGDAAAVPVLNELLDDESPRVRWLARIGLALPVDDEPQ